ncbi:MAG: PEP-CTERM sorting domain-containing protein, partial [Roseibacillus sp.]
FDNYVELRGINYNASGGGNWMGHDYVALNADPIPEPSSPLLVLLGSVLTLSFLRRRNRG